MAAARKQSRPRRGYHHGDLARSLGQAAVELIEERGIAALSLRELARRAGVSHAAPAHHFGDRAGLLTAVATEGFRRFGAALADARQAAGPNPFAQLAATGRAYVHFAARERGYFELMFRPEHLNQADPELQAASQASYQVLLDTVIAAQAAGMAPGVDPQSVALGAWASVHGLATLWLDGNLTQHIPGVTLEQAIDMVFATKAPG